MQPNARRNTNCLLRGLASHGASHGPQKREVAESAASPVLRHLPLHGAHLATRIGACRLAGRSVGEFSDKSLQHLSFHALKTVSLS